MTQSLSIHAHFPANQTSGSHRPPNDFRKPHTNAVTLQDPAGILIPFDHWVLSHAKTTPLTKSLELLEARATALVALGKGLVYSAIEAIKYVFTRIFSPTNANPIYYTLCNQWDGVKRSLHAIYDPNGAFENAEGRIAYIFLGCLLHS
jgi:hypothetical protein